MNNIMDHINYAMVAKSHSQMYMMHKYWARKPHNVVSEYIKHYSKEGDIVFDPFLGSGVTVIEAVKLGRKGIGVDLDPMSIFITKCTAKPVNLQEFKIAFENIKKVCENEINNLYRTKCKKCKNSGVIIQSLFLSKDSNLKKEEIKEIYYICNCSGNKIIKKDVSKEDLQKISEIDSMEIPYWYPKEKLIWNSRLNVSNNMHIYDLFTKRNLISLSIIYAEIEKIKEKDINDLLKFTFTSTLAQASKMIIQAPKGGTSSASWKVRGYWIPEKHRELNVWHYFENRFNQVYKGKKETQNEIKCFKEGKNFNEILNETNILLYNKSSLELSFIPSDSIDYIFTDPPYGDSVPYLEVNYMWSLWLKFNVLFEEEIIVSDSPVRNKTDHIYERMLKAAFIEIYRVLKPNKFLTVTFHNTKIKYWNAIISAVLLAGFNLEKIIYQPPAKKSSKGSLHPYGTAFGDYYIRFRKPQKGESQGSEEVSYKKYERIVLECAKKILAERGEPTPYTFILNGIIVGLKREGALLLGKKNPDEIMRQHLDKEFILIDIFDNKGKKVGQKWWFKDPNMIPYLDLVPLSDRIETAIIDVLNRKVKVTFDDILQEIFIKFPNALTPDTLSIKTVLTEYAKQISSGQWILKPVVKRRESDHAKIIYYLVTIGKKAGYDIFVGKREQSSMYSGKKLAETCTETDPQFRFIPSQNLDRVKQIDVIWYKEGIIYSEFEVENTTVITEAIIRGSNIPNNDVKRFIIIPEEREEFLYRKLEEPILKENVNKNNWKFMVYKDIEEFFKSKKRKKDFDISKFEKLARMPRKQSIEKQLDLLK